MSQHDDVHEAMQGMSAADCSRGSLMFGFMAQHMVLAWSVMPDAASTLMGHTLPLLAALHKLRAEHF